jgi:hypothetical protein
MTSYPVASCSVLDSLQPRPDTPCIQRPTVADKELGRPKVQEVRHAGSDLTEVVGVIRVARLAGSKHATEPAAHQQIPDDGFPSAQQDRNRALRMARRVDDFSSDAKGLQRHLVWQEDIGPDRRELVIHKPMQELRPPRGRLGGLISAVLHDGRISRMNGDGGRCGFLELPGAAAVIGVPMGVEDQSQILDTVLGEVFQKLLAVVGAAGIDQDRSLPHDQERVRQAEAASRLAESPPCASVPTR